MPFRGLAKISIDRRDGSITLAERFRREATDGLKRVVVTVDPVRNLFIFPADRWQDVATRAMRLSSTTTESKRFIRIFVGQATALSSDRRGRLTIPREHLAYCRLEAEAVVLGQQTHLVVWDLKRWEMNNELWSRGAADDRNTPALKMFDTLELGNILIVPSTRIEVPSVLAIPASRKILSLLRANPGQLKELGAQDLEVFVCDRLEAMGFSCHRVGGTYNPDGGVDLIICPKERVPFDYLLAVQVKSHQAGRKSGSRDVRDFVGEISSQPVRGGVLITNTTFTMDARWFAAQSRHFVQLRDFDDLSRWIHNDFLVSERLRDLPEVLELCPGVTVRVRDLLYGPGI